jgi:hypothetical protein
LLAMTSRGDGVTGRRATSETRAATRPISGSPGGQSRKIRYAVFAAGRPVGDGVGARVRHSGPAPPRHCFRHRPNRTSRGVVSSRRPPPERAPRARSQMINFSWSRTYSKTDRRLPMIVADRPGCMESE